MAVADRSDTGQRQARHAVPLINNKKTKFVCGWEGQTLMVRPPCWYHPSCTLGTPSRYLSLSLGYQFFFRGVGGGERERELKKEL